MTEVGFGTRQFDPKVYDLNHHAILPLLRKSKALERDLSAAQCSFSPSVIMVYTMTTTTDFYFTALLWTCICE